MSFDTEMGMARDFHGDHGITGRRPASARMALALETDLLAIFNAGGNGNIKRLAIGQTDAHARAMHGIGKRDGNGFGHILATLRLRTALLACATASAEEIEKIARIKAAASAALTKGRAAHVEFEMLERITAARTTATERAARTKTFEAARLAIGIDLAAIKLRALFLVAQNFIGRRHFGEFFLRFGIARVLVGREFSMRRPAQAMAALMCSAALSACSVAVPLPAFISQDDVTGSIARFVSPLSDKLDPEDWRHVLAALGAALDPQGQGAPVAWDNPLSGLNGAITPVGPAFPREGRLCRAFLAEIGAEETVQGTGCRDKRGEWAVVEAKPVQRG